MLRGIDGFGSLQNYNIGGSSQALGDTSSAGEETTGVNGEKAEGIGEEHAKGGHKSSPEDCETCKKRKYQDGSDESDVSFQNPTHIDPNAAPAAVRAHEQEHVMNAYQKAKEDGGKVLSVGVSIHTSVCPECGRVYVSGGLTTSRIAYPKDSGQEDESEEKESQGIKNPYDQQKEALGQIMNIGIRTNTIT